MQPRAEFIQPMLSREILHRTLGVLAIVAGVLALYWPAIGGTWLWDDGYEIAHNPVLRDSHGLAKIWSDPTPWIISP